MTGVNIVMVLFLKESTTLTQPRAASQYAYRMFVFKIYPIYSIFGDLAANIRPGYFKLYKFPLSCFIYPRNKFVGDNY